ncbi:MAG: dihydroneopterin aldolase family protein [Euryarchaeota archaeon]|nr:dihydroneopterin aldolase family protein [Euryarchaeota archaeon]
MMAEITDRDTALFESGIKLGALYHQFVGSPVNLSTAGSLEAAIRDSISLQPCVRLITVAIDREMIRERINDFGYCELEGRMLGVEAVIRYGTAVVYVGMRYDAEMDYPMMSVQRIEQTRQMGKIRQIDQNKQTEQIKQTEVG